MNFGPILFFGVFVSFALSWAGLILMPQFQVGRAPLVPIEGKLYPTIRPGEANQGREVYRSLGCAACHTQQVRENDTPTLGIRFTVAQDYLRDEPVMLGSQRIGPDLMNIGLRRPDIEWQLRHLYDPQVEVPKSMMPTYKFLFEERKAKGSPSAGALRLPEKFAKPGVEIVPKREAVQLVAYLMSLRADLPLYESPLPKSAEPKPTNAAPATATNAAPTGTNAPAAETNAAASQTNPPAK